MINIWIDPNNVSQHSDLYLEIAQLDFSKIADTYFFVLDAPMGSDTIRDKVRNLLGEWVVTLKNKSHIAYLPFDFSDEYIGCIRVRENSNNEVFLDYGISRQFSGSGVYPSEIGDFVYSVDDFQATTDSIATNLNIILHDLEVCITKI